MFMSHLRLVVGCCAILVVVVDVDLIEAIFQRSGSHCIRREECAARNEFVVMFKDGEIGRKERLEHQQSVAREAARALEPNLDFRTPNATTTTTATITDIYHRHQ